MKNASDIFTDPALYQYFLDAQVLVNKSEWIQNDSEESELVANFLLIDYLDWLPASGISWPVSYFIIRGGGWGPPKSTILQEKYKNH